MRIYGLIGKKLSHSFSQKYFTKKFEKNHIKDAQYQLFELQSIQELLVLLQQNPAIEGLNVTIPYKEEVLDFIEVMDGLATQVGAVNTIKRLPDGRLKGYNTDCIGFEESLKPLLPEGKPMRALVLGTGGASKAVKVVLTRLNIPFKLVSRSASENTISYEEVTEEMMQSTQIIINTTPLGMEPNIETKPDLPYHAMGEEHILYDLIYNPEITRFMEAGLRQGARAKNGYEMLQLQADAAWEIWNKD